MQLCMVVKKMWCTECLPNALTEGIFFSMPLVGGTEIYAQNSKLYRGHPWP